MVFSALFVCFLKKTSLLSLRENLSLVTALGDRAAQGRAFGNLGNTHYLLGNFRDAVIAHEQVQ